jgi:hypothetical protein
MSFSQKRCPALVLLDIFVERTAGATAGVEAVMLVALNMVALTIFLWHMTAYLVVLWAYEGLGRTLLAAPTAGWWAQRWLWILAPSAVLAVLVVLFARVELAARRPRGRVARRARHSHSPTG